MVNEFEGMEFEPEAPPPPAGRSDIKKKLGGSGGGPPTGAGGPGDLLTGADVLRRFCLGDASVSSAVRAQCRVLAFHCWTTLCLLRARQPRYVSPSPAADVEIVEEGNGEGEKKEK